ncbi:hypothetical protein BC941DRAFT_84356 [Chlamydoabsidia padenii]|nr:hypothetical protein BC941DRAFT_84356 [Chlamydoabsidia padenii]
MGNINLLNLISRMLLPNQIGELVCLVKFKSIRIFGDHFDTGYLDSSFVESDVYMASSIWQLLNAEVQVSSELVNHLATSDFIRPLKEHYRPDMIPHLLTILSNIAPTRELLRSIVQISNQKETHVVSRMQFSLVVLKAWHDRYPDQLYRTLVDWFDLILDELDVLADDSSNDLYKLVAHFIQLLRLWWMDSNSSSISLDLYLQNRPLMVKLSKTAASINQEWPKEWIQETTTTGTRKRNRKVVESSDED